MEVDLPRSQEVQLNELAAQTGRGTDDLVQEAVAKLLAHSEWFKAQVQIGRDRIARGEFIEEEEMDARMAEFFTHKTIDELRAEQNVPEVTNLEALAGLIPEEDLEEFVADIYRDRETEGTLGDGDSLG
jgi:predicted transcriptional regulator